MKGLALWQMIQINYNDLLVPGHQGDKIQMLMIIVDCVALTKIQLASNSNPIT